MPKIKYRIIKEIYKTRYGDSVSYRVQFLEKFLFWKWWQYTRQDHSFFYDRFDKLEEAEFRIKQLKHGIKEEVVYKDD
jgi:hypothetical protein